MKFNKLWKTEGEVDSYLVDYFGQEVEKLKINIEIQKRLFDADYQVHLATLRAKCNKRINELEHEFHGGKELKGIELAKLDALIEARKENVNALQQLIRDKDKMIDGLLEALKVRPVTK